MLIAAAMLTHFPRSRHPLTIVAIATVFAGLMAIAPDAAVLAGQLGVLALVALVVLITVRTLIVRGQTDRVFTPGSSATTPQRPSTRELVGGLAAEQTSMPTTQALPPSSPSEAST